MLGSQALETAIGLVLMFFVISTAASTIIEIWSRVINKRAKHLEHALTGLLAGSMEVKSADGKAALKSLKGTSAYDLVRAGGGLSLWFRHQIAPAYLSAKTYADAVVELLIDEQGHVKRLESLPAGLRTRLTAIVVEVGDDLTAIRARLERGFDETMERIEAAYKRWATLLLFLVGLVIAGVSDASTLTVAHDLWQDSATRQVVVDAAAGIAADKASTQTLDSVASAADELDQVALPVGWTQAEEDTWSGHWWPWQWQRAQLERAFGWLVTALLVMLGGPFWFDLLTRLVSLRSSGSKPTVAPEDPTSASFALTSRRKMQIYRDNVPADRGGMSLVDWVEAQLEAALHAPLAPPPVVPAKPPTTT